MHRQMTGRGVLRKIGRFGRLLMSHPEKVLMTLQIVLEALQKDALDDVVFQATMIVCLERAENEPVLKSWLKEVDLCTRHMADDGGSGTRFNLGSAVSDEKDRLCERGVLLHREYVSLRCDSALACHLWLIIQDSSGRILILRRNRNRNLRQSVWDL